MDLLYKIEKVIKEHRLINEGDNVLVGVSGGIDSVVLLHILLKISEKKGFNVAIAHVNHQLRGSESDRDETFVKGLADRWHIPFYSGRFDVQAYSREKNLSIQHGARDIRYAFFNETAQRYGYNRIAIAHNLDDQIETFLLRLIKGSGLRGLSSIPMARDRIIRPLLYTYRSEIEGYAEKNSIPHVEDSSNEKTYYERNYIRKNIIPLMEGLNPAFKEKVYLLLNDITEIDRVFHERVSSFLEENLFSDKDDMWVAIDSFMTQDSETRYRVLSEIINSMEQGFIPLRQHMQLVDKIIHSRRPNLTLSLPGGLKIKKIYNKLVFTKKPPSMRFDGVIDIHDGINILEPFGLVLEVETYLKKEIMPFTKPIEARLSENIAFFDRDRIGRLSVRCFLEGDRFMPLGMDDMVKVKDFFISRKIPLDSRRKIPFLLSDNDIIWIIGHRIDNRFKVTEDTENIMKVTASALPSKRDDLSE
ncbi:MAG TPA: tRNA lysidine(34) synthetase TilS [Syntrophorhabdaceae bacterium]|nr:tRNA lysidine(34) synthetase TilS [Syntrophorhabdaceae bacterium]HOT42490.1 tRNA lysidine(34) synthetase TilS [Syntrophorhabdaceae bacterium]HPC65942.1 tRNA lysidine(34) synthetase TilS [Syntrophorhabdaceae bacterium]HQE81005.1 tRNA lysidine(34) synthetase TilS [Syntrophorhabdaceae bacterium]HQH44096.1 tRNA lysidine(34) synthetase TilS [Syntrophorhabdaceae bacterium]